MRVLSVTSEAYPLVKTGGLADVAGALPPALGRRGIEVRTLLPGYPAVMAKLGKARVRPRLSRAPRRAGAPPRRPRSRASRLIVIDAPPLYDRPGSPYGDPAGADYPDNWRRFGALGRAAADVAMGARAGLPPRRDPRPRLAGRPRAGLPALRRRAAAARS